jgi:uncharacterized protein YjcR
LLDRENVRVLYLKGYNAVEIARKLQASTEAVRKCIQRNFWACRNEHEIAANERKEEAKAINYESKQYMSDRSFIMKNRSIYKTLPNGDIVLNKEVAGTVTWDTPKRLINQYK